MDISEKDSCRGCLAKPLPTRMHSFSWQEIKDLFMECTGIKVAADERGYPQQICSECYSKCEQWFSFRTMCQEVNQHLVATIRPAAPPLPPPPPAPKYPEIRIKEEPMDDDFINCDTPSAVDDDLASYTFGELIQDQSDQPVVCLERLDLSLSGADNSVVAETALECMVCYSTVDKDTHMRDHLKLHYSPDNPQCPICEKTFDVASKIYFHYMAKHHSSAIRTIPADGAAANCPVCCQEAVPMYKHILSRHLKKGQRKCPICSHRFSSSGNLRCHIVVHTGERPFECKLCSLAFGTFPNWSAHVKRCHPEENDSETPRDVLDLFRAIRSGDANDDAPAGLPLLPIAPPSVLQPTAGTVNRKPRDGCPIVCPCCDKTYEKIYDLKIHFVVHTDERPFYCAYCKYDSLYKGNTRTHVASAHPGECTRTGVLMKEDSIFHHSHPWELRGFYDVDTFPHLPHAYNGQKPYLIAANGQPMFRCGQCPKLFQEYKLLSHSLVHTREKPFGCNYCGKKFAQKCAVKIHIETVHRGLSFEDGFTLDNESEYAILQDRHKQDRHKNLAEGGRTSCIKPRTRMPCCNQCKARFITHADVKQHILEQHEPRESHPIECKECGNSFPRETELEAHMSRHSDKRPFLCTVCGYKFKVLNSLNTHMKKHQVEGLEGPAIKIATDKVKVRRRNGMKPRTRPPSCNQCKKKFITFACVKQHILEHHEPRDSHPLDCKVCGNSFQKEIELDAHMSRHSEERPFPCTVCGYKFKVLSRLNTHMKNHNAEEVEGPAIKIATDKVKVRRRNGMKPRTRPPSCNQCKKTFITFACVKRHILKHHEPRDSHFLDCEVCGNSFQTEFELKAHKTRHSEKRPFPCTVCGYKFKALRNLKLHVKQVHGAEEERKVPPIRITKKKFRVVQEEEDLYSCTRCDKQFLKRRGLTRHLAYHTKDDTAAEKVVVKMERGTTHVVEQNGPTLDKDYVSEEGTAFVCKECGRKCSNWGGLQKHLLRTHGFGEFKFRCGTCKKGFASAGTLKTHSNIHLVAAPYSCNFCGVRCNTAGNLRAHMRRMHDK